MEGSSDLFQLHPILYPALPDDHRIKADSPAAISRAVRCSEPFGTNLYLGSSDGQIHWYSHTPSAPSTSSAPNDQEYQHVASRTISTTGKPVERIMILTPLSIAAVLSEATLSFYELPDLQPVHPQVLPHTKGVASVVIDDAEGQEADGEGLVSLCIIKRKQIILVKVGSDTWRVIKEIPLPSGALLARRFADALCIATSSDYSVVNLSQATLSPVGLPISETSDSPSASVRPSILSVSKDKGNCVFLLTSHSQDLTLGVFITPQGGPTAEILEWPSHPRALALEYPYLHALLRNDTIEIHNVQTMQRVQILHLPSALEPRLLSSAATSLEVVESASQDKLRLITAIVGRSSIRRVDDAADDDDDARGQMSWKREVLGARMKSRVLLVCKNAVQCLCMTRTTTFAMRALIRGDFRRCQALADEAWSQVQEAGDDGSKEALELEYINQVIGFWHLKCLRFEQAGAYLLRSGLDLHPILCCLFPDLIPPSSQVEKEVEIFADIEQELVAIGSCQDYVRNNLEDNYSPPLDVDEDDVLQKLFRLLMSRARGLVRTLLEDHRSTSNHYRGERLPRHLADTALAQLYAQENDKASLTKLLAEDNECDEATMEPLLEHNECWAALAKIKERQGDWARALDLSTRLIGGELVDAAFAGTVQDVATILSRCDDSRLVRQYGLWLVQRDADAGIKLLTRGVGRGSDKLAAGDHQGTLSELRKIDEKAAEAFLEYLVLSRKQSLPDAHMDLVTTLLGRIASALEDDAERQAMAEVATDYREGAYEDSFVAHLALRIDGSKVMLERLKLIMLLQGSQALNVESLLGVIQRVPILMFEQAVLLGKLRRDREALQILAIDLRDANSAEAFCHQGGQVLSPMLAERIANDGRPQLKLYATLITRGATRKKIASAHPQATMPSGKPDVADGEKSKLLRLLLQIYLDQSSRGEGGEETYQIPTAHLLNTQAIHLSTLDILKQVPDAWPLKTLETFLTKKLRGGVVRRHQGLVERGVCLAQNLEVNEVVWARLRSMGGVIQDEPYDDDDGFEGDGDRRDGGDDASLIVEEKKFVPLPPVGDRSPVDVDSPNSLLRKDEMDQATVVPYTEREFA